jgi:hypothetical protein
MDGCLVESDFWMRIGPTVPNAEADEFTFKSELPIRDDIALARAQAAALVNVYPNPMGSTLRREMRLTGLSPLPIFPKQMPPYRFSH